MENLSLQILTANDYLDLHREVGPLPDLTLVVDAKFLAGHVHARRAPYFKQLLKKSRKRGARIVLVIHREFGQSHVYYSTRESDLEGMLGEACSYYRHRESFPMLVVADRNVMQRVLDYKTLLTEVGGSA
jgi:hypothetical protein